MPFSPQVKSRINPREAYRALVPELDAAKHKGQAGKIGVIGGCAEYTGAPYFAAMSALRLGADLAHVFCSRGAAPVIKAYSPELIVHPYLLEGGDLQAGVTDGGGLESPTHADARRKRINEAASAVMEWLPRLDALVIGPGLGRDETIVETVMRVVEEATGIGLPLVVDADGLHLVTRQPDLIAAYQAAVLTPNVNELRRLATALGAQVEGVDRQNLVRNVSNMLRGVTIVSKGAEDYVTARYPGTIYQEEYICENVIDIVGSPRRCGGQGDVLAGAVATFLAWGSKEEAMMNILACMGWQHTEQILLRGLVEREKFSLDSLRNNLDASMVTTVAASLGCTVTRMAAARAFEKNKRAMLTTDIIPELGPVMDKLFPVYIEEDDSTDDELRLCTTCSLQVGDVKAKFPSNGGS